jgi:hypothetical protein
MAKEDKYSYYEVSGKPASKHEFAYDLRLQYSGLGSKPFLPALDSTLTSNNFDDLACIVLE